MAGTGRDAVLANLSKRIREVGAGASTASGRVVSTGVVEWDQSLMDGGIRAGSIVEWLADGLGAGAEGVALAMVREALRNGGVLVVVDAEQTIGFAGLLGAGIDSQRVLVLRPGNERLALWSVEQALRSRGVSAVWWRVARIRSEEFRRLQLAAEIGGGIGVLFREANAARERTWAELRVMVRARPSPDSNGPSSCRRIGIEVLKARGGRMGMVFELELSDDGSVLRLVPELADPAAGVRTLRTEGASSGPFHTQRAG